MRFPPDAAETGTKPLFSTLPWLPGWPSARAGVDQTLVFGGFTHPGLSLAVTSQRAGVVSGVVISADHERSNSFLLPAHSRTAFPACL